MWTASDLGRLGASGLSALWRGIAGAFLCYLCAGIVSWIAYAIVWLINGDTVHWLREIWSGALGGAAGAYMGIWVLEHTFKRYPGRSIAWIYCSLWALGALILLARTVVILLRIWPAYTVKDIATPLEFHQTVSGLAESAVFYYYLIRPKVNLMKEHQEVLP
jgi:hypothetical protein